MSWTEIQGMTLADFYWFLGMGVARAERMKEEYERQDQVRNRFK